MVIKVRGSLYHSYIGSGSHMAIPGRAPKDEESKEIKSNPVLVSLGCGDERNGILGKDKSQQDLCSLQGSGVVLVIISSESNIYKKGEVLT